MIVSVFYQVEYVQPDETFALTPKFLKTVIHMWCSPQIVGLFN